MEYVFSWLGECRASTPNPGGRWTALTLSPWSYFARFTKAFPLVHCAVAVRDYAKSVEMLRAYEANLALIFQPGRTLDFEPSMAVGQRLVAAIAADHPLVSRPMLRLRDCADYPLALLGALR